MDKFIDILKKTVLFLLGIVLIIWGYRANIDDLEGDEAEQEINQQKKANGVDTSTEFDGAEESSGSQ